MLSETQDLLAELACPDPRRSQAAAEVLIAQGGAVVKMLTDSLEESSAKYQWKVLNVLAKIGDARAIPGVIDCLNSENLAVRIAAVQCLQMIGDDTVVPYLLEMLTRQSETGSQMWIIQALGAFHDERVVRLLLKTIRETDSSVERYTAIEALGQIGDRQAVDTILQYLNDDNHHVRTKARVALEVLGVAFE